MDTKRVGSNPNLEILQPQKKVTNSNVDAKDQELDVRSRQRSLDASVGVAISEESLAASRDRAKALEIARQTPDVREDKVAELKKRIAAGTYQVDSGKVADGMLREAIREHLAENTERA